MDMSDTKVIPDLPLPLDVIDGKYVVASVWGNDDVDPEIPIWATLLLVQHSTPHYVVEEIVWTNGEWKVTVRTGFDNIVPAVEDYKERGGDY